MRKKNLTRCNVMVYVVTKILEKKESGERANKGEESEKREERERREEREIDGREEKRR